MATYPETMKRAQAEIDAVVGRARLPQFNDRSSLPYVRAMVKEVSFFGPSSIHSVLIVFFPRSCDGEVSVRPSYDGNEDSR